MFGGTPKGMQYFQKQAFWDITCSTVVLQCYRRQTIPVEQAKIRPSVTLYSLDRSSQILVCLITSAIPTQMPILVKIGWVGNSPQTGEITCSTVVLQCYRRQAIPMEQAKIRPSVTLYSLDRSSQILVWLITSVTPTQMTILVKIGWVGNSPQIGEI